GAWRRAPLHVVSRKPPSGGCPDRAHHPVSVSANRTPGPQRRTGRANVKGRPLRPPFFFESAGLGKMVEVPDPLQPTEHRYGRGGFLLLVAGGASSLLWAGPVSSFLSPLTSAGSQLVGNLFPVGGWRIYTISGSMPIFDRS